MRIPRADVALALKEHEPLRPITVGVLLSEDPAQEIPDRLKAAQREQQFHRPLTDIAGPPAATGVLFQTPRGQVVNERVMHEPGEDIARPRRSRSQGTRPRRGDPQAGVDGIPESPAMSAGGFN